MSIPKNKKCWIRYKKIEPSGNESDDSGEEYEVERIVDMRCTKDNTREFMIQWKGYRSEYNEWKREDDLNCPDLLKAFLTKAANSKKLAYRSEISEKSKKGAKRLKPRTKTTKSKKMPEKVCGSRSSKRHVGKKR